ncbi:hypothetical protein [Halorubrum distributum]|uniref:Uncharacterized protein n=2 Tax=Halorubrum distributum TaxID=29283 RepID=M0NU57_9EURY|nr:MULTISPECIES: hypothetical protein [Halorubrum distributum group]EMA60784.1 hypothetical protein C470_08788 [Halorubrum litoreum JCM 13561]MYL67022.1 hypothetical protein [Halorubrum terrestre]
MDTPETEAAEGGADRSRPLPEGTPLAFADRDPTAIDDATELYLLDRHSAADGTVRVQVLGWERDGDLVRVAYALPTGERLRDRYRWPTAGRYDESDFLALVRGLGYPPGAANLIAGEFARARSENGRWRIVTGRRSDGERDSDAASGASGGERDSDAASGGERAEPATAAGERAAVSDAPSGLRERVRRLDPMATGSAAVVLLVLAVVIPATLATLTGGLTAASTALGGVLGAAALATLRLSIAAVS